MREFIQKNSATIVNIISSLEENIDYHENKIKELIDGNFSGDHHNRKKFIKCLNGKKIEDFTKYVNAELKKHLPIAPSFEEYEQHKIYYGAICSDPIDVFEYSIKDDYEIIDDTSDYALQNLTDDEHDEFGEWYHIEFTNSIISVHEYYFDYITKKIYKLNYAY